MKKEERLQMFIEVQSELKDELGVELSIEEINNVFVSQFKIMAYGFTKGIATTIPFFGKFLPYEKDFYKDHFIIPNRKEQERLLKEGDADGAMRVYKESLNAVQAHKREAKSQPSLSADQVLAYNRHIDIPDDLDIIKNMK
jgi:hypothetical protein